MNDTDASELVGQNRFRPLTLTREQEELCNRLDELYRRSKIKQRPSDMLRGALFTAREEFRSNPDWMAQSAHSLREILYQFTKEGKTKGRNEAFQQFGSVTTQEEGFDEMLGRVLNKITRIAHHSFFPSEVEFEKLVTEYQMVMKRALTRQTDIHEEIERFFSEEEG